MTNNLTNNDKISLNIVGNIHKLYLDISNVLMGIDKKISKKISDGYYYSYEDFFKEKAIVLNQQINLLQSLGNLDILLENVEKFQDKKSSYPKNLLNCFLINILKYSTEQEKNMLDQDKKDALSFLKNITVMLTNANPEISKGMREIFSIDIDKKQKDVISKFKGKDNLSYKIPASLLTLTTGAFNEEILKVINNYKNINNVLGRQKNDIIANNINDICKNILINLNNEEKIHLSNDELELLNGELNEEKLNLYTQNKQNILENYILGNDFDKEIKLLNDFLSPKFKLEKDISDNELWRNKVLLALENGISKNKIKIDDEDIIKLSSVETTDQEVDIILQNYSNDIIKFLEQSNTKNKEEIINYIEKSLSPALNIFTKDVISFLNEKTKELKNIYYNLTILPEELKKTKEDFVYSKSQLKEEISERN